MNKSGHNKEKEKEEREKKNRSIGTTKQIPLSGNWARHQERGKNCKGQR